MSLRQFEYGRCLRGKGTLPEGDEWSEMSTQARFDLRRRRLVQPSSFNHRLGQLLRPFPSASRTDVFAPLSQPQRGCSSTFAFSPAGPSTSNIRWQHPVRHPCTRTRSPARPRPLGRSPLARQQQPRTRKVALKTRLYASLFFLSAFLSQSLRLARALADLAAPPPSSPITPPPGPASRLTSSDNLLQTCPSPPSSPTQSSNSFPPRSPLQP